MYEPAIHFQRVFYEVEGKIILDNVTGSFPKGKITALVGPSGAGKTTLLKMCNGLLSPTAGKVYKEGQLLHKVYAPELRRATGIVLQSSPMVRGNVYANLALPLQLQGKELSEERARWQMKKVGLSDELLHQDTKELSGGQRQKVSIARTLMNEPDILLLDEITSALDASSLREIEDLITKIHKEHQITVIWITHNLEQARRMGQYVWVMMDGKLAEAGEISVLDHPNNAAASTFLKGAVH